MNNVNLICPEESHLDDKDSYTKEEINSIPIFWCKDCLSLRIRRVNTTTNISFCDECSSTEIVMGSLSEWRYRCRALNKK